MEEIQFLGSSLNPVDKGIVVSSFMFILKDGTTEPLQMLLNVCINKVVAETDRPEFPVYVPATQVYHTKQHYDLLAYFRAGNPFCAVIPKNLRVYRRHNEQGYCYCGSADDFLVWGDFNEEFAE